MSFSALLRAQSLPIEQKTASNVIRLMQEEINSTRRVYSHLQQEDNTNLSLSQLSLFSLSYHDVQSFCYSFCYS